MRQTLVPSRFWVAIVLTLAGVLHCAGAVSGQEGLVTFDFHQLGSAQGWAATHDVELSHWDHFLKINITGSDPYLTGPVFQTPPSGNVMVKIELLSEVGGGGQLFYYDKEGPREENSVRFSAPAGRKHVVWLPLPECGPRMRFRLDPPGQSGECLIEQISVFSGLAVEWPQWEQAPRLAPEDTASLSCGSLELRFSKSQFGMCEVFVEDRLMGASGVLPQVGIQHDQQVEWIKFGPNTIVQIGEYMFHTHAAAPLPGGGELTLRQQFIRSKDGQIDGELVLSTTEVTQLVYAPLFLLFPGQGAFGTEKGQALLPGVEYLENEPSSSDADVDAARALRRVPSASKITFPLMAVQVDGRYLGLIWEPQFHEPQVNVAALFDSPDRQFGTQSHVMGLISPGATNGRREDGNALPRLATRLDPIHPIRLKFQIIAGPGESVVPAVQRYVQLHRFPDLPPEPKIMEFANLLGAGWIDSPLRDGPRFRHAVAGDAFKPQPAADAIWMMRQLSMIQQHVEYPEMQQGFTGTRWGWTKKLESETRLGQAADEALAAFPPGQLHHAAVGHIRSPNGTLLLGDPAEGMRQARQVALEQLARLGPEGKLEYVRNPDRPDFARTHWSKEANGLVAPVVARALEEAAFSGDQALIDQALAQLRKLDKYAHTVPRGAQTWEIPLHTPDILASAYLVKAYMLGYELTRDPKLLEQAKYWAWTGVPFVYLQPQFPGAIGNYATIPVLGATHWDSVLWIGLPVQWCGLVYADALAHLQRYDESGPWWIISRGIVLSGLQQTYPDGPHKGLLPDSFNVLGQSRQPADINPGTLQVAAVRTLLHWECYDVRKILLSGWTIHAPARISVSESSATLASFSVEGWTMYPYSIVVHGLKSQPRVTRTPLDGARFIGGNVQVERELPDAEERYDPATGTLILKMSGMVMVTLDTGEKP